MVLCKDFGADHSVLFFHANVCWLLLGHVTKRAYELRIELLGFFQQCENFVTSLK